MVLNAAARLVVGAGKFDHFTPVHHDVLHWLPAMPQQIQFNVARRPTVFDCARPRLWSSIFQGRPHPVDRHLYSWSNFGSVQHGDMVVPQTRTQLGRQSFHAAAPVVWNTLPVYLCSTSISRGQFRAALKPISLTKPATSFEDIFVLRVYCTYLLITYLFTYLLTVDLERSGTENWMSGSGAGAERELGVKKYDGAGAGGRVRGSGAVSGGYRRRCERWAEISTVPAPLICSDYKY